MANARGKKIDGTYLSIETAAERGFAHSDYIAHCLRWSHVVKFIRDQKRYETARILDIGCGKELPMAKTLYSSRLIVDRYIGLDYNSGTTLDVSPFHTGKFPAVSFGSVDFASDQVWYDKADDGTNCVNVVGDGQGATLKQDYFKAPNIYVSFEVLEHVEPAHCRAILNKVKLGLQLAKENGSSFEPVFFVSTPCWDVVHCADNHVSEMKHEALGWLIEDVGLEIRGRYGTFASQKDYKHKLFADYPGAKQIYEKLHSYYESNYLATIFAPLYPAEARNCLWELVLPTGKARQFEGAEPPVAEPWTSSERWHDLASRAEGLYDPTKTGVGRIER